MTETSEITSADRALTAVVMDPVPERTTAEEYFWASRSYAEGGGGRLALLAQCAADLEVLQLLLRENGLDEAPDPSAQLVAVGEAVLTSMDLMTSDETSGRTTLETVEAFRVAVAGTFDESVRPLLAGRWSMLDHLDGLAVSYGEARGAAQELLAGRTPGTLMHDLRATADDCTAVAELMIAEGDTDGALMQLWQADLAVFEAHLIRVATHVGDTELVTVQLRWELARRLVSGPPESSEMVVDSVREWRHQLTSVVSSSEAASLAAAFPSVPLR